MKDNEGFTLIELLAVIVILAIIMVVAIPQILNVIDYSRTSAQRDSKKILKEAIKEQIMSSNMYNIDRFSKDGNCYLFDFDEDTNGNVNALQVKNKDTFTGSIKYCSDGFKDDNLGLKNGSSQSEASHIVSTRQLTINETNFLTVTTQTNRQWSLFDDNVINIGMYQGGPSNFYYKDKIVVTANTPTTVSGKVSLWRNLSSTNAKMRIGFSKTTDNNKDSFDEYQELNQNFKNSSPDLPASTYTPYEQSFEVTIDTPGEYYFKGVYYMTTNSWSSYGRVYDISLTQ